MARRTARSWVWFSACAYIPPSRSPEKEGWDDRLGAAGAAIVSLIGHAHDASAPEGAGWLLGGAVALGLLALIAIEQALQDAERLILVYRPLGAALAMGAVAALVIGWVHPAPWLLALLLVAVLSVVWASPVLRFLRADAWGDAPAAVD